MNICIRNTETKVLVDLGSVCTIINRSLANAVVLNSQENFWVQSQETHELKTFTNKLINTIGVINTSVKCNDFVQLQMSML